MIESVLHSLQDEVAARYGVPRGEVRAVLAPYRVCPLGAHIDHQLGCVTAMALDRGVLLCYAPWPYPEVRMTSRDFPGEVRFRFDSVSTAVAGDWGNYLRGAVMALQQRYSLPTGMVGITAGSVPEGGLSSSAAVGVAYLLALEDVNGLCVSTEENIVLDQYIENTYLGLRNGVLDQSAILLSRSRHLTVIDCATLEHKLITQPAEMPPFAVLIVFSGLRRALVSTDYNRRVAECTEAAKVLLAAAGRPHQQPVLRNVSPDEYRAYRYLLHGPEARRAEHFFSEMERVEKGIQAWQRGDMRSFGELVSDSGRSSIENYQCGAPPLVELYKLLVGSQGVFGARFSGAGFRGCCLALVESSAADTIAQHVLHRYRNLFPQLAADAHALVCTAADGARLIR